MIDEPRPSNIKLDAFPTDRLGQLYYALRARIGVIIRTPNVEKAKNEFYRARADAYDAELRQLEIRTIPEELKSEGDLVIVKVEKKGTGP